MAANFKQFLARIEAIEAATQPSPDPALQEWLARISTPDLERLVDLAKRAQTGELVGEDDYLFYTQITATAPDGIFRNMTGD